MATSPSARKRIRQSAKQRARNRWRKDQIKGAVREFTEAVHSGDKATAAEKLRVCYQKLDSIADKGTVHKKTASRRKSRLTKAMNRTLGKS